MVEARRRNSRCWEGTAAADRPGCMAQRHDGSVEAVVGIGEAHPGPAEVSQQPVGIRVNCATMDASRMAHASVGCAAGGKEDVRIAACEDPWRRSIGGGDKGE
jgi:hypothetical protein